MTVTVGTLGGIGTERKRDFYRPHPKMGEGTVFTGVCLFTPGGGGVPTLAGGYLPWPDPDGGGEYLP